MGFFDPVQEVTFAESISHGPVRLVPALTGLTLAIAGVLLLASPEPRRLEVAAEQCE